MQSTGIYQKLLLDAYREVVGPGRPLGNERIKTTRAKMRALNLVQLFVTFAILGAGLVLSIFAFVAEKVGLWRK